MSSSVKATITYMHDGNVEYEDIFSLDEIGWFPFCDKVIRITFFNEALEHVQNNFTGIPLKSNATYLKYTGDLAKFILYNW